MQCLYTHGTKKCPEIALEHLDKCIFHATREQKLDNENFFKLALQRKLDSGDYDFNGYEFLGQINFAGREFQHIADFGRSTFWGGVDFSNCHFRKGKFIGTHFKSQANFNDATFDRMELGATEIHHSTSFSEAVFEKDVYFDGAKFFSDFSKFDGVHFNGDASFRGCTFTGKEILFRDIELDHCLLDFERSSFRIQSQVVLSAKGSNLTSSIDLTGILVNCLSFELALNGTNTSLKLTDSQLQTNTAVSGLVDSFVIRNVNFEGDIVFSDIAARKFSLASVQFHAQSHFRFNSSILLKARENIQNKPYYSFKDISFNPNCSHFEDLSSNHQRNSDGIIQFERCILQDVDFTRCETKLFNFGSCAIGGARFTDCKWPHRQKRMIFKYIQSHLLEENIYIDSWNSNHLAEKYRELENSFNIRGNYRESGFFYFNRWETTRRALLHSPRRANDIIRWILYSIYWSLAGYGEKPVWSFIWFVSLNLFAWPFLFLVFLPKTKYTFSPQFSNVKTFIGDWFSTIWETIQRTPPIKTLLSGGIQLGLPELTPAQALVILINFVLLSLIAIGVQRHFKRF